MSPVRREELSYVYLRPTPDPRPQLAEECVCLRSGAPSDETNYMSYLLSSGNVYYEDKPKSLTTQTEDSGIQTGTHSTLEHSQLLVDDECEAACASAQLCAQAERHLPTQVCSCKGPTCVYLPSDDGEEDGQLKQNLSSTQEKRGRLTRTSRHLCCPYSCDGACNHPPFTSHSLGGNWGGDNGGFFEKAVGQDDDDKSIQQQCGVPDTGQCDTGQDCNHDDNSDQESESECHSDDSYSCSDELDADADDSQEDDSLSSSEQEDSSLLDLDDTKDEDEVLLDDSSSSSSSEIDEQDDSFSKQEQESGSDSHSGSEEANADTTPELASFLSNYGRSELVWNSKSYSLMHYESSHFN